MTSTRLEPDVTAAGPSSDTELATLRSKPSQIRAVLLATDLSMVSEEATRQAIDLAASIGRG